MSFAALLDNVCDFKCPVLTADGKGGFTETWTVSYTNVPCRFETTSRKLEILAYGGKSDIYPDYLLYLEYRSGIKEGDHVFFGSKEFEIKLVEDWSEQGKYMRLSLVDYNRATR